MPNTAHATKPPEAAPAPRTPAAGATGPRRPATGTHVDVARLLGISVPVSVALAQRPMSLENILAINVGTILEFDVPSNADLTLYVANQPVGKGAAVKVGENFGLRLTRVGTVKDRIDAMASGDGAANSPRQLHRPVSTQPDRPQ